ncbi:hypothetical protein CHL78_005535 [Romboutsia weinsteinii]|uniref:DUF3244 domain-containing protein n=1 Tax=Romboutsia weinsteinii TaxID=2020949 RepID=A0A371J6K0_9FIRM|nr:hypothetical protein [Romboutsia weinsteinii]RDY28364.1 hypothetical protein CHL78_005535 [Romboutsia weinsteinii]
MKNINKLIITAITLGSIFATSFPVSAQIIDDGFKVNTNQKQAKYEIVGGRDTLEYEESFSISSKGSNITSFVVKPSSIPNSLIVTIQSKSNILVDELIMDSYGRSYTFETNPNKEYTITVTNLLYSPIEVDLEIRPVY